MVNQQIVKYIQDQEKRGYNEQQLKTSLLNQGYKQKDIDEAILATKQLSASTGVAQTTAVLKKKNIFLMILLVVVTASIYAPAWYMKTHKILKDIPTKKKPNQILPKVYLAVWVTTILLTLFSEFSILINLFSEIFNWISLVLGLVLGVQLHFILKEYFNEVLKKDIKFSIAGTLIFNLLYLQHKINVFVKSNEQPAEKS